MKNTKKVKYPKVDGKEFDHLRKAKFDELRESFAWVAKEEMEKNVGNVSKETKKEIEQMSEVIGWNCAYMVVTNE